MSEQVDPDMPKAVEAVQELDPEPVPEPEFDDTLLENDPNSKLTDTVTNLPSELSNTENTEDQSDLDKTTEDDSSELTNSKKSRELKSILALSKEANLDTNLSRKRKTLDGLKPKETSPKVQPEVDVKKVIKLPNIHNFKFPVTAESELEQDNQEISDKASGDNSINPSKLKRKRDSLGEAIAGGATDDSHKKSRKRSASELKMFKTNKDIFCWRCHREGVNVVCETCPRSYHQKCLKQTITDVDHWPCPECVAILKAESTHTRSEAMKGMSLDHLCSLLKFALNRMMACQGSEPFLHPVNDSEFPEYLKYIIQPMDLTKLQYNIKGNHYGSTQAFEADAKWILHNSIIFNSYQSKLTYSAKNIMKICKQEMAEIENCPSCYLNANTKKATWFVEVCPRPHLLVWAKLKGFPYWPAKAMSCTSSGMVDVRFFGAHDRAWVNYKDCFLYSEKDPNTFKQKRSDIEKCVEELNIYIDNLRKVYGEFRHAPFRTPLDPLNMGKQMLISIPKCKTLTKRRKSLKTSEDPSFDEIKTEPKSEENVNDSPNSRDAKKEQSISEPNSNRTTPACELDTTMEGYGTDDDSVTGIDLERRRALVNQLNKAEEEDDDDADTQVPSNVSLGVSKMVGGSSGTPSGKSSISQGKKPEAETTLKRVGSDEILPAQRKTSRRNSDLSVKSDSSLLSNISDKINRVDISENMEISLGNEDITISDNVSPPNGDTSSSESSFEHKRKPVQVDIDNAEITISPSSKLKISEQLMKRLSGANDKVEEVKKSVFGNELPQEIDDKKPSTSNDSKKETQFNLNQQEAREGSGNCDEIIEKEHKSPTRETSKIDDATEKEVKESEDESIAVKNVENSEDIVNIAEANIECEIVAEKEVVETEDFILETTANNEEIESEDEVIPEKESAGSEIGKEANEEVIEGETNLVEIDETSKEGGNASETNSDKFVAKTSSKHVSDTVNTVESTHEEEEEEEEENDDAEEDDKNKMFNIIHSSLIHSKTKNKVIRDPKKKRKHDRIRIKFRHPRPKIRSKAETSISQSDITKATDTTSDVSNKPGTISNGSPTLKKTDSEHSESDELLILHKFKSTLSENNEISLKPTKTYPSDKATESRSLLKSSVIQKPASEPMDIDDETATTEETRNSSISYSKVQNEHTLTKSDNPLKSSEITEPGVKVPETESRQLTKETTIKQKEPPKDFPKSTKINDKPATSGTKDPLRSDSKSSSSDDMPLVSLSKSKSVLLKQKRPSSEEAQSFPTKIIKLVPIDSIIHQKEPEASVSSPQSTNELIETVKSEPNSDEDISENENLEAKRQYLSALNISEKTGSFSTNKAPEIRTRAKAEERREKYRKVDNLTKIIDDVALNYVPDEKGSKQPPKKLERRKSLSGSTPAEGEIYVKSFAKMQTAMGKQRARKTFPMPSYVKPPARLVVAPKKDANPSPSAAKKDNLPLAPVSKKDVPNLTIAKKPVTMQPPTLTPITKSQASFSSNSTSVTSTTCTKNSQAAPTPSDSVNVTYTSGTSVSSPMVNFLQTQKPAEMNSINMSHVILMPTPTINYCSPLGNPFLNTQVAVALPAAPTNVSIPPLHSTTLKPTTPNIRTSQNYVPQGDNNLALDNSQDQRSTQPTSSLLNNLLNQVAAMPDQPERTENATNADSREDNSGNDGVAAAEAMQEDEFAVLNTIVPENVSRAVSDLLLRPPPRLKPRPPSILSGNYDDGIPSSAGDVTARINSIAHRMTDYFRGMLIETMTDLGKAANPEAKIINLQAEIEKLKHKHNLELSEMRENICTILKDVQRSIVEERERVKNETRASCEAEAIKRIELAKSKQWCANCSKEAQFYCCWNTSYCDYPCQQKHWTQHMGKCTQNIEKTNNPTTSLSRPANQPIILRPAAPPKPGVGRIVTKPTKVYLNRAASPQKVFKTVAASGNHITVIETTPGNYELVGNGSMTVPGGAKFYSMGSNVFTKLKTTGSNSTPTSAITSSTTSTRVGAGESSRAASNRGGYAMPVTTVLDED